MKYQKYWLIFIALIVISSLAVSVYMSQQKSNSHIADVYLNGKIIKSIDLSKVDKPKHIHVDTGDGHWNDLLVSKDGIKVHDADCPDKLCIHQGNIDNGIKPIVCLPHKLVIRIRNDKTQDHSEESTHHHDSSEQIDDISK